MMVKKAICQASKHLLLIASQDKKICKIVNITEDEYTVFELFSFSAL